MQEMPFVTLLVLNWNGRSLLPLCLSPLIALDYPRYEIVLADNGSTDDSLAYVREHFPQVQVMAHGENLGFSRGMNAAMRQIESEIIVLLNNDVAVRPDWLTELVRPFSDPTVGITGSKLLYPDGQTIQHAGAELSYPLAHSHHFHFQEVDTGQADSLREVPYVTGAALAVHRRVLDEIGLFDEQFSPFYYEEVDWCYRVREAGYRVLLVGTAVAIHHESASLKRVSGLHGYTANRNRLRFVLKHYTAGQFLEDFVPAEVADVQSKPASANDLVRLRRAYLETLLALPETLQQRGELTQMAVFQAALNQLLEVSLMCEVVQRPSLPDSHLQQQLNEYRIITEPTFQSDAPLVGPLIAAFRQQWNDVSTKWYVRLIMEQQQAFNALVARLLAEQSRLLAEQSRLLEDRETQVRANAQDVSLLANQLLEMQQQINELTQAVALLQEQLEERETDGKP
jgi:GT2 family glycosyltransferase